MIIRRSDGHVTPVPIQGESEGERKQEHENGAERASDPVRQLDVISLVQTISA
ncbi:MAG: hypothetical protein NTY35_17880 [Planctomycetota bacterium]|nr:hypothetical protein [Planctomycetota bacterium]